MAVASKIPAGMGVFSVDRAKVRKTIAEYERFKVAFDRWLAAGREVKIANGRPDSSINKLALKKAADAKFEIAREALYEARSALS